MTTLGGSLPPSYLSPDSQGKQGWPGWEAVALGSVILTNLWGTTISFPMTIWGGPCSGSAGWRRLGIWRLPRLLAWDPVRASCWLSHRSCWKVKLGMLQSLALFLFLTHSPLSSCAPLSYYFWPSLPSIWDILQSHPHWTCWYWLYMCSQCSHEGDTWDVKSERDDLVLLLKPPGTSTRGCGREHLLLASSLDVLCHVLWGYHASSQDTASGPTRSSQSLL